jgi:hypothetical protein
MRLHTLSSQRMSGLAGGVLAAVCLAAGAVLGLAGPAGAVTGTAEISPEQAGYTATGAQFKEIDARVYLRQPGQYAGEVGQYSHSVQLWSSGYVAVVGVRASTSGSTYTPYAKVFDPSGHQLLASDPGAQWCDDHADGCSTTLGTFAAGETVDLSIEYDATRGFVHFGADFAPAPDEAYLMASYQVGTGVSFTQARVGTEFGSTPWDGSYSHTPPAQYTKIAAFSNVKLITYSGHTSSLWSWWVHHKLLANTGQQSGADWVAIPTDLTSGGASFQTWFVPQSAQGRTQPVLH